MILYKNVSEKKSFYSGKCMETKDVYNHGLDIKNPRGYIEYADA